MVKAKTGFLQIFTARSGLRLAWVLPFLSLLSFISSCAAIYPSASVERRYARAIFPEVSFLAGRFADSVPFAWLDVGIVLGAVLTFVLIRRRKWLWIANIVAVAYLVFFWSWGLNYHRQALQAKLQLDPARMRPEAIPEFASHAVSELDRLYAEKRDAADETRTRAEADRRVRRVVSIIDGTDWDSAHRIKISWIGNPWLHAAGIDGVFNPLAHEPIVSNSLLDIE